jgi:hypothetical protein
MGDSALSLQNLKWRLRKWNDAASVKNQSSTQKVPAFQLDEFELIIILINSAPPRVTAETQRTTAVAVSPDALHHFSGVSRNLRSMRRRNTP